MEPEKKQVSSYLMVLIIVLVLVLFNISYFRNHTLSNNEKIVDYKLSDKDINPVREAAVAGLFYPADNYQLKNEIDGYFNIVKSELSDRAQILIVPHAGYRYSAKTAALAYKRLIPFKKNIKKVFLLGPSHNVYFKGIALTKAGQFKTPLGYVAVDQEIVSELLKNPNFSINEKAHKKEHSLEVQIPFLQRTLEDFKIIPMLYGEADYKNVAEVLSKYLKSDDAVLIASADLSHYMDYENAKKTDNDTAKQIDNFQNVDHHQSCGATAINTVMEIAKEMGLVPHLLDIINSGDVSNDKESVVGYGAWAYHEEEKKEQELSGIKAEQKNLYNFAKHNKAAMAKIVIESLKSAVTADEPFFPERKDFNEVMFNKGASFISIYKNGELRGCIGSIVPFRAIAYDLANNAYNAAMNDNRFAKLKAEELKDISFTISLLTNLEKINYSSYEDLLKKIEKDSDGLILKDGKRSGVFLPVVWKELNDKQEFMNGLKIKAGISPSYWSNNIEIFRFRVVEIKDDKD